MRCAIFVSCIIGSLMLRQLQRKSFCNDRSSMQKKWRRCPPTLRYLMLPLPHFFCTAFVYVLLSETCRSLTKTASPSWAGLAALHANHHEFFISSHASPQNAASTPPATAVSGDGMCDDELLADHRRLCKSHAASTCCAAALWSTPKASSIQVKYS